jgi:hypothetical protein
MNFTEKYQETTDQSKLKFLDAKIRHNTELQQEFLNFIDEKPNETNALEYDSFIEIVKNIQKKYRKLFEAIDVENPDWENYHPPHDGYIEDWEAYQYASEQEIGQIFEQFESEAINLILRRELIELTAALVGLYEATQDAEIEDDIDTFEDVNEYLLGKHSETVANLSEKIKFSAIHNCNITHAIELFLYYCKNEYPGNEYFPNHFEYFIMALADKTGQPNEILAFIDKYEIRQNALPELMLMLNKEAGNDAEWIENALKFYKTNDEVAKQLLDHYFNTDKTKFVEKAKELFNQNKNLWAPFLENYMSTELDKNLFFDVFWQLTVSENKTDYYNKIRKYLDNKMYENLIEEVGGTSVFAVQIFSIEKQYERIKNVVETMTFDWHFEEIISHILNVFPEYCFKKIESKALHKIENERGRHAYEKIASMMKLLQNIKGYKTQTQKLITKLYNYNNRLSALKDEFRQAGLMQ